MMYEFSQSYCIRDLQVEYSVSLSASVDSILIECENRMLDRYDVQIHILR